MNTNFKDDVQTSKTVLDVPTTDKLFSTQEILNTSGVDVRTWNNFLNMETDVDIQTGGYHNLEKFYSEDTLKKFQAWLLKNQASQGRSSTVVKDEVKQSVVQNLVLMEVANSGNIEVQKQYLEQMQSLFDAKNRNLQLESTCTALADQCVAQKTQIEEMHNITLSPSFSADAIGKLLGISGNRVGRLAKKNNLKLAPEFGRWESFQSANGRHVGNTFLYNDKGLQRIKECLAQEILNQDYREFFN